MDDRKVLAAAWKAENRLAVLTGGGAIRSVDDEGNAKWGDLTRKEILAEVVRVRSDLRAALLSEDWTVHLPMDVGGTAVTGLRFCVICETDWPCAIRRKGPG